MNFMVPVKHRQQIDYNFEKLGVNAPSTQVLEARYNYPYPFALNHINRKLLLEPKVCFLNLKCFEFLIYINLFLNCIDFNKC